MYRSNNRPSRYSLLCRPFALLLCGNPFNNQLNREIKLHSDTKLIEEFQVFTSYSRNLNITEAYSDNALFIIKVRLLLLFKYDFLYLKANNKSLLAISEIQKLIRK